jgi:hypothetical protein
MLAILQHIHHLKSQENYSMYTKYRTYFFLILYTTSLMSMDLEQEKASSHSLLDLAQYNNVQHAHRLASMPMQLLRNAMVNQREANSAAFRLFTSMQRDMFFEQNLLPYIGDEEMGNCKALNKDWYTIIQKVQDGRAQCLQVLKKNPHYAQSAHLAQNSLVIDSTCSTAYVIGALTHAGNAGVFSYDLTQTISYEPLFMPITGDANRTLIDSDYQHKSAATPQNVGSVTTMWNGCLWFLDRNGTVKTAQKPFPTRNTDIKSNSQRSKLTYESLSFSLDVYPDRYITTTDSVTQLFSDEKMDLYALGRCMPTLREVFLKAGPSLTNKDLHKDESGIRYMAKKNSFNTMPIGWELAINPLQHLWHIHTLTDKKTSRYGYEYYEALSFMDQCKVRHVDLRANEYNQAANPSPCYISSGCVDKLIEQSPFHSSSYPLVCCSSLVDMLIHSIALSDDDYSPEQLQNKENCGLPKPQTANQLITFFTNGHDGALYEKITKKIKNLAAISTLSEEACAKKLLFLYLYGQWHPYQELMGKLIMSFYSTPEPKGWKYAPFVPINGCINGNLQSEYYHIADAELEVCKKLPKAEAIQHVLATAKKCANQICKEYVDEVIYPPSLSLFDKIDRRTSYFLINSYRNLLPRNNMINIEDLKLSEWIALREK